jgi:hypothetical protein
MTEARCGAVTDGLLGHVVDDFGAIHKITEGFLGSISTPAALAQFRFWTDGNEVPAHECEATHAD